MSVGNRERQQKPEGHADLRSEDDDWIQDEAERSELMDLSELKDKKVAIHVQQEIRDVLKKVFDNWGLSVANRLKKILVKYYSCLSEHKFDFGTFKALGYEIPMNKDWDGKPIFRKPYNGQNPDDLKWAEAWCEDLCEKGVMDHYWGP